jgi:hypothetical protein
MATIQLKQQEIRAGDLVIKIGSYGDMNRTSFVQIMRGTEGHVLAFNAEGELLGIKSVPIEAGAPPAVEKDLGKSTGL